MTQLQFYKYQALGNDMIVIDPAFFSLPLTPQQIQWLCDRHFGAGADGICYGPLSGPPFTMRFFNPDGSEAEKSGNGLRIFARYLWDAGYVNGRFYTIAIQDTLVQVEVLDDTANTIALEMGQLHFTAVNEWIDVQGERYEITAVSIGNPHCVLFSHPLTSIHTIGTRLETTPQFPNRTNVQLVQVLDNHTIQIEIWERGAGYTLASGTSSCAAAGAAIKNGYCQSPVEVRMAGGTALVTVRENWQVKLRGAVSAVYRGVLTADIR